METPGLPEATPPTSAEVKQEDRFEKASANPDKPSLLHLSVYARTFLGGLILFGMILFYVTHLSGHISLENYGQPPTPAIDTRLANP
jgi:hypothetical protein